MQHIREIRNRKFWSENLKVRDHFGYTGVDVRGFIWLRIGSSGESCEHGNGPSGSIKGREFLGQPNYYQLIKNYSAPWSRLAR
jgi:hypothetical protein